MIAVAKKSAKKFPPKNITVPLGLSIMHNPSEEFELTASTQQAHMKPYG